MSNNNKTNKENTSKQDKRHTDWHNSKSKSYQAKNVKNNKLVNDKKIADQSLKKASENKQKPIVRINREVIQNKDKYEQEYLLEKQKEAEKMAQEAEILDTNTEKKLQTNEAQKLEILDKEGTTEQTNTKEKETDEKNIGNVEETKKLEGNKAVISETINNPGTEQTIVDKKQTNESEKKDKRPSRIDLKDKSEQFKKIIDVALAYEKMEGEKNKLKEKSKALGDTNRELKEENESLKGNLEATELLCKKKQQEINELKFDVAHRNEVIDIVKADKSESEQEFKNALAASLKTYMQDYMQLKALPMSDDVGYAIIETLESVFKVLDKNGIHIQ